MASAGGDGRWAGGTCTRSPPWGGDVRIPQRPRGGLWNARRRDRGSCGRMRAGDGRGNGSAHLQGWSAEATIGWGWSKDLVSCKHRGKEIVFRGSGTPDQLRGNPLIPVIENTTLGRRAALDGRRLTRWRRSLGNEMWMRSQPFSVTERVCHLPGKGNRRARTQPTPRIGGAARSVVETGSCAALLRGAGAGSFETT
jgi:hypothetical protein